jgi:hypothetical protein
MPISRAASRPRTHNFRKMSAGLSRLLAKMLRRSSSRRSVFGIHRAKIHRAKMLRHSFVVRRSVFGIHRAAPKSSRGGGWRFNSCCSLADKFRNFSNKRHTVVDSWRNRATYNPLRRPEMRKRIKQASIFIYFGILSSV